MHTNPSRGNEMVGVTKNGTNGVFEIKAPCPHSYESNGNIAGGHC